MSGLAGTAARTAAERARYGDFYDGPPAGREDVPLLAVMGNGQAESLRLMLEDELDVVLARSARLRGLLGLDLPADVTAGEPW